MAIVASTHVLLAGPLLPAVPSVVRATEPSPVSGMEEVAETTVVPVAAEVMTTDQNSARPTSGYVHIGYPTKLPGTQVILAFSVQLHIVVTFSVTVMLCVSLVPTALFAVSLHDALPISTHVLLAGPLLPAVLSVVRATEPSPVSGMEEVAETTVVPVAAEVMTTVQLAVAPPPV